MLNPIRAKREMGRRSKIDCYRFRYILRSLSSESIESTEIGRSPGSPEFAAFSSQICFGAMAFLTNHLRKNPLGLQLRGQPWFYTKFPFTSRRLWREPKAMQRYILIYD